MVNVPFAAAESLQLVDVSARAMDETILLPFAFDELYCRGAAQGWVPAVHIWRHNRAFVLGLRDRRLPFAETAMRELTAQGYSVCVRNSGGAAVPLDPGVVNISAIIPKPQAKADIRADFVEMAQLIRATVARISGLAIKDGEVGGAYCPGEFDLSAAGKKFCGISQRRQIGAIVVQAFVNVEGDSGKRAEAVRHFYQTASGKVPGEQEKSYPLVVKDMMASLSEFDPAITVDKFTVALISVLQERIALSVKAYPPELKAKLGQTIQLLKERYDR
ncbi:MAG TPA: biotin--protein ligase [Bacilli bacterium]